MPRPTIVAHAVVPESNQAFLMVQGSPSNDLLVVFLPPIREGEDTRKLLTEADRRWLAKLAQACYDRGWEDRKQTQYREAFIDDSNRGKIERLIEENEDGRHAKS